MYRLRNSDLPVEQHNTIQLRQPTPLQRRQGARQVSSQRSSMAWIAERIWIFLDSYFQQLMRTGAVSRPCRGACRKLRTPYRFALKIRKPDTRTLQIWT